MTRTHRPLPLSAALLFAVAGALVAFAVSGGHEASAHPSHGAVVTQKQLALHDGMHKLWEDHVTWTRLAVIGLVSGSPDTDAAVARLLRNQADIGNAVKPYYGNAAGTALTRLLREHILIAADLIAAAKKGDTEAVGAQQARWTANADELAALLNGANPRFWKLGELKSMLHRHLKVTTDEVVARLTKNWAADVRAYDAIHVQALHMADMLADGIVAQFPARFR